MRRHHRLSTNVSALILLLLFVTAAHAATFKEIERKEWRNGEPVAAAEAGGGAAIGEGSNAGAQVFSASPDADPVEGEQQIEQVATFEIEPEAEEEVGDPVCVRYSFTAEGSVSANPTELAAAAIGIGGPSVNTVANAGPPPIATVSFGSPVTITVNPSGSPEVVFEQAPVTRNNNGVYSIARSGVFPAVIGDDIELRNALGTAWAVLAGGSVEGENALTLSAEVIDRLCPSPSAVPASSPVGLAILVMVLLAIGWLGRFRLG